MSQDFRAIDAAKANLSEFLRILLRGRLVRCSGCRKTSDRLMLQRLGRRNCCEFRYGAAVGILANSATWTVG